MTKLFMFEKPLGMRDTLPLLYEAKMSVRNKMLREINSWGYQLLETPALEYYETVGEASAILDQQLFKLLDQQGHTLVLRPDMTAPIARVAASKLLKNRIPLRLSYAANVYRAQQREGGRPAEFEQIGIECIGNPTVSGDAESIALLISTIQATGLKDFKVSVGHVGFVQQLFLHILGNEERAKQCRKFLFEKNYVGFREHVKSLHLSSIDKQKLEELLSLQGQDELFERGRILLENEEGAKAIAELEELWKQLQEYDVHQYVSFDLTLVSHMSYYTGILFEVYADRVGFPIGNGGRYDNLLSKFGYHAPATGFAVMVDRLLEALGEIEDQNEMICVLYSNERRSEAITKGKELRAAGKSVVLQDLTGLEDVDAFTKTFCSVEYIIGSVKEEAK